MTYEEKQAVHDFAWKEPSRALMTTEEATYELTLRDAYYQIRRELSAWDLLGKEEEEQPPSWKDKAWALCTDEEKLDTMYVCAYPNGERVKQFSWLVADYGFQGTLHFVAEAFRKRAERFDTMESSEEDRKVAHAWRRDADWLDRQARKPERFRVFRAFWR
jgi:hypothetical protein